MLLPGLGGRQVLLVPPALRPRCPHASGATGLEITRGRRRSRCCPGTVPPGPCLPARPGLFLSCSDFLSRSNFLSSPGVGRHQGTGRGPTALAAPQPLPPGIVGAGGTNWGGVQGWGRGDELVEEEMGSLGFERRKNAPRGLSSKRLGFRGSDPRGQGVVQGTASPRGLAGIQDGI